MTPSIVIAVLALLFTISSFWWIQVRRGRLVCPAPGTYAGYFGDDRLLVVLPLVLYNTGPAPIVILDFRLWLKKPDGQPPLHCRWRAVQPGINPAGSDGAGRVFPSPLPVEGRRAVERFIEFGCLSPNLDPTKGPYAATVEMKVSHRKDWQTLISFDFNSQISAADPRRLLVRPNDPEWEES